MKKRTLIFALFILVLPMVLAACGGGLDEGELEDAFEKAFNDGDVGDLNDMLCEDEQAEEEEFEAPFEVESVDCSIDDDNVECSFTASVEGESIDFTITGTVDDDDKLCDISEPEMELPEIPTVEGTEGEPTEETEAEPTEETEAEPTEETEAEPTEEG
ncbi:MAG: hypothetical protein L0154_23610 [Chloroflexi bacterium]|nr:hypothetical protein [Chloroflexota bacterium]